MHGEIRTRQQKTFIQAARSFRWRLASLAVVALCVLAGAPASALAASPAVTPEAATGVGIATATLNASVNPNGLETTYRFEYGTTTSYGTNVPVPDKSVGSGKTAVKVAQAIGNLTSGTTYHFRIEASNADGTSFGTDKTLTTEVNPHFSSAFGTAGTGDGQFEFPTDVAFDSSGNIWVVDQGNNRVEKFNSKGEYLYQFGSFGTGDGQFRGPQGLAIDASGNLWVSDNSDHRVQKFNSKGEYLLKFGSEGAGEGQFHNPQGIAIDSLGNLWVVDDNNSRIQKWV